MDKHRAIPPGYMTVGEIAKKMGVTVRTLQYYDRQGLLAPSGLSGGGRRLYTDKDMVRLHQIQSMKYLGFSLQDIKTRLPAINTPGQVAEALAQQAGALREKIDSLTEVLHATEALHAEVLQMDAVDWAKYADILVLLQAGSTLHWATKHFSDEFASHVHAMDRQTSEAVLSAQKRLFAQAGALQAAGTPPESAEAQAFAAEYWVMVLQFTGGDMSLLPELSRLGTEHGDSRWQSLRGFIEKALDAYLTGLGQNPFDEAGQGPQEREK